MTKLAELRELGGEDLAKRVLDLDDRVFRLRMQQGTGEGDAPNKMRELRRKRIPATRRINRHKFQSRHPGKGINRVNPNIRNCPTVFARFKIPLCPRSQIQRMLSGWLDFTRCRSAHPVAGCRCGFPFQ